MMTMEDAKTKAREANEIAFRGAELWAQIYIGLCNWSHNGGWGGPTKYVTDAVFADALDAMDRYWAGKKK